MYTHTSICILDFTKRFTDQSKNDRFSDSYTLYSKHTRAVAALVTHIYICIHTHVWTTNVRTLQFCIDCGAGPTVVCDDG